MATRSAFEEVVADPGPTSAVEPRLDLVVVGDGHPRIGRERLATDGNLVDADSLQLLDDAGGRLKLAPPGSGWRWNVRRRSLSLARASWDICQKGKQSGHLIMVDGSTV